MDRNPRSQPLPNGRLGQRFCVLQTEHRRRKRMAQGVVLFSSIYTAHHQHASGDAGLPQDDPLIGGRYPEPLCAFLLQRQRAPRGAVSVGVALHYRADGYIGAHMLLQHPVIVTQGGKRNFSPIGPGLDTRRCKGCSHPISIIQASRDESPAARGLLNSSRAVQTCLRWHFATGPATCDLLSQRRVRMAYGALALSYPPLLSYLPIPNSG